jgi:hypothetical protein
MWRKLLPDSDMGVDVQLTLQLPRAEKAKLRQIPIEIEKQAA